MNFLLDADTVSFAMRGEGHVAERLRDRARSEVGVSSITVAELRFGANRRKSRRLTRLIDLFVEELTVLPFGAESAEIYGRVAATLATSGTPIGVLDTMVAAQALEFDLTLVTHNLKHFRRIPGLEVEDWFPE